MEVRIVIFLAFASVTVVTNTMVIVFAYRMFARLTAKVTETVAEVRQNTEVREWIKSLGTAAEQAAMVTESTKVRFAEFDPILERAQENYRRSLTAIDARLEQTAEKITAAARDMRDTIAKPAFSMSTAAAGIAKFLRRGDMDITD